MAKRYIAVDFEADQLRLAILTEVSGKLNLTLQQHACPDESDAAALVTDLIGERPSWNDRVVACLPARSGLFRRFEFPFREKKKLDAILPLELTSQLPLALEDPLISFLAPRAQEDGNYAVDVVACEASQVARLLQRFPAAEQYPQRIDIFPFALLPALGGAEQALLLCCRQDETVVALVQNGVLSDYRLLPGARQLSSEQLWPQLRNQMAQLEAAAELSGLPVWLVGSGLDERWSQQLTQAGRTLLFPLKELHPQPIESSLLPVALLALAEQRQSKKRTQPDFRQRQFALRGQFEVLRGKLIAAALLALLIVVGGAATLQLGYLRQARQVEALQQQIRDVFYRAMPATTPLVDAGLQLQAESAELQQQIRLFGVNQQGATETLTEMSAAIDKQLKVDLDEFTYADKELRISGSTVSFDAVNQIRETLLAREMFAAVEVVDAKLSAGGGQVNFQMQLQLNREAQR